MIAWASLQQKHNFRPIVKSDLKVENVSVM